MSLASFDLGSRPCRLLCEEFGQENVERALMFVGDARNPVGLRVIITPTYEMIRSILEAIHGRLGVGSIRVIQGDKVFYHHPDGAGKGGNDES